MTEFLKVLSLILLLYEIVKTIQLCWNKNVSINNNQFSASVDFER